MSYIRNNLNSDEHIIEEFGVHWVTYIWPVLLTLVLLLGDFLALIGIVWLFWVWLKNKFTEMAVSNKRVILKVGIISRNTDEMQNKKIETVSLRQSVWGRIMGYGGIVITGTGEGDVVFYPYWISCQI